MLWGFFLAMKWISWASECLALVRCIEVKMTHLQSGKCSCMIAHCRKFTGTIFATEMMVGQGCICHGYLAPAILSHISCPAWALLIMMIPFNTKAQGLTKHRDCKLRGRKFKVFLGQTLQKLLYKVVFINDWWVRAVMFLHGIHNCFIHTQQFS